MAGVKKYHKFTGETQKARDALKLQKSERRQVHEMMKKREEVDDAIGLRKDLILNNVIELTAGYGRLIECYHWRRAKATRFEL